MSGSQSNKGTEVTTKRKAEEQDGGHKAKQAKIQEPTQSAESKKQPIWYLLEALLPPTFPVSSNSTTVPTNGMISTSSNSIAVRPDSPPPLEHPSVFLTTPTSLSTPPQPSSNTSPPPTTIARTQPDSLTPLSSALPIDFQEVVKFIDESSLSTNELYKLFCERDDTHLTAFHRAFLNHTSHTNYHRGVELVKLAVRKGMPFQWILNLLFMTHGVNKLPLQLIAENSKVMEAILTALRAGDLGKSADLFLASDGRGRSFFEEVRQHPRCMEIFLEAFPADQQAKIIAQPVLRKSEIKATRARGADKESKENQVRPTGLQAHCAMFTGTQPASSKTFPQALREFVDSFVVQPQITQASPISAEDNMRSRSSSGSSPS